MEQSNKLIPIPPPDSWMEEQIEKQRARMQAEFDYMFGLTHYDWMYRTTGDEKYLEEQQKYIRDNKK